MPLALQALLPFSALLGAAAIVRRRPRRRGNGWIAAGATGLAAVSAVIFADDLLLVYIALQLLTLAWSGALDEESPRRRGLRLVVQVADIGLLLAAASAIQSVGTSAFSGVPSDTFGLAPFVLVLLPVMVRIGALTHIWGGPKAAVSFEPALAWIAPAGYL